MNDIANAPLALTPDDDPMASVGRLWPSPEYTQQVEQLRAAVGETIYLVELEATQVQLGIHVNDQPYTLLGVVDFPRPDPIKGLAPHLVLLDDGRGVNLGRIARITTGRPFSPAPADILFQDRVALQALLFRERQLSKALIAQRSKQLLGQLLGEVPGQPRGPATPLLPEQRPTDGPANAA